MAGGTVYAGGLFANAGVSNGTPRRRLAAFDESDGTLLTWNPTGPTLLDDIHAGAYTTI